MYPYSSTRLVDAPESIGLNSDQDPIEDHVQSVLSELEQLPADVQVAVYARLLNGLAAKLTSAVTAKAIAAAKTDPNAAKPKAAAKGRSASKAKEPEVPRLDSRLRQLNDATDPAEAWRRFGGSAAQLFDVLREEPTGVLEAMLAHRNMPQGPKVRSKSREKLAEAIAERLEKYYRGW